MEIHWKKTNHVGSNSGKRPRSVAGFRKDMNEWQMERDRRIWIRVSKVLSKLRILLDTPGQNTHGTARPPAGCRVGRMANFTERTQIITNLGAISLLFSWHPRSTLDRLFAERTT